ncbi:hypothetical protein L479_02945 [Exiguobacterium sp. S17]|nr:hypothetical protein L479_02945 [Exiguobacterium sp. S17]
MTVLISSLTIFISYYLPARRASKNFSNRRDSSDTRRSVDTQKREDV